MNRGIFTTAILAAALLSACTKESLVESEFQPQAKAELTNSSTAPTYFASQWEGSANWLPVSSDGLQNYSSNRATRQVSEAVINDGMVLAFARGYNFLTGEDDDKPLGMPFYFSLAAERFMHPYYYYLALSQGNIKTVISMHPELAHPFLAAKSNLQFRYFVIPPAFLAKHNLSTAAVKNKSYNELVALLGTTP